MTAAGYPDSALVLVAHGSTLNAGSGAPALLQAAELRRRGAFAEVAVGFWKQEPSLAGALRSVFAPRVFVVPFCISDGWFTRQVLPRELGIPAEALADPVPRWSLGARTLHYCRPVGSHPSMTEALLARAREVMARFPFPRAPRESETALFIAGHGTAYSRGSFQSVEAQVARIRGLEVFGEVHGVFLEEEPRVEACWSLSRCRNLVLVPFFLSDGLHTQEDIPVMLGEPGARVAERIRRGQPPWRNPTEREGRRLWLASSVGLEPRLSEVILERVREAAPGDAGTAA